jgi:hypothetical protein
MSTNRIQNYSPDGQSVAASPLAAGFAVCQLPQVVQNPLALQLLAQQQAFEQALIAAKEEALRIVLSRLRTSVN